MRESRAAMLLKKYLPYFLEDGPVEMSTEPAPRVSNSCCHHRDRSNQKIDFWARLAEVLPDSSRQKNLGGCASRRVPQSRKLVPPTKQNSPHNPSLLAAS